MRTIKFLFRRLIASIFVLLGLSILIFVISRVMPGDPARTALGPRAPEWTVQTLRAEMHLDRSLPVQYYYWVKGILHGDFGKSLFTQRPVVKDSVSFLPATLELALFSIFFMVFFGILFGIISTRYHDTYVDNGVRLLSYIGVVTPSFVFAILFMLLLGYVMRILPTMGRLSEVMVPPPQVTNMITIDALIAGNLAVFWDAFTHLIMPAVSLAMAGTAQIARITRSAMADNLQQAYIVAERSYGIPERIIMFKYLLKPSLIPTVSLAGMQFGALLGNAFLVELIFNWPGLSRYGMNVLLRKDLNAISAVVLIFGLGFVLANVMVDIIVNYLDPRIRISKEE